MALTIVVKAYHRNSPELRVLMEDYLLDGGKIGRAADNDRLLPFDDAGELTFTQDRYEALDAVDNIRFERGHFYAVLPASQIDNLVPVGFPDSKYTVEEGVEHRRQYQEYFPWNWELPDGTFLVRMVHAPEYNTMVGDGLSDENRLIFQEEIGTLLVRSEGEKLKPVPPELQGN